MLVLLNVIIGRPRTIRLNTCFTIFKASPDNYKRKLCEKCYRKFDTDIPPAVAKSRNHTCRTIIDNRLTSAGNKIDMSAYLVRPLDRVQILLPLQWHSHDSSIVVLKWSQDVLATFVAPISFSELVVINYSPFYVTIIGLS